MFVVLPERNEDRASQIEKNCLACFTSLCDTKLPEWFRVLPVDTHSPPRRCDTRLTDPLLCGPTSARALTDCRPGSQRTPYATKRWMLTFYYVPLRLLAISELRDRDLRPGIESGDNGFGGFRRINNFPPRLGWLGGWWLAGWRAGWQGV